MHPERKNIRLKDWDYSSNGLYFTTICCKDKVHYFGTIANNKIHLSKIGNIALKIWNEIPAHFSNVVLDEYVIMPNHIHGIILINSKKSREMDQEFVNRFSRPIRNSLSVIINQYKSSVTRWCIKSGLDFKWQPRFYDHIIRDEKSYDTIREYIVQNPMNWIDDENYT